MLKIKVSRHAELAIHKTLKQVQGDKGFQVNGDAGIRVQGDAGFRAQGENCMYTDLKTTHRHAELVSASKHNKATFLKTHIFALLLISTPPHLNASAVAIDFHGQKAWLKTVPIEKQTLSFCGKKKLAALLSPLALARPTTTCGLEILNEEARRLKIMLQKGAPVPPILEKGRDYLILSHEGQNLEKALAHANGEDRLPLLFKAAHALEHLHTLGEVHGRAMVKDMVLTKNHTIAFIDLAESPLSHMTLNQAKARDWLMFLFSSLPFCENESQRQALRDKVQTILTTPQNVGVLKAFNHALSWGKRLSPLLQHLSPHLGKDGTRLLLLLGEWD